MLKRLHIYFKEMYPLIPRLALGFIIFGEIYFIVLLNYGVKDFHLGIQEAVGGFTVFSFLLWLRIADDFKDYELDCRLFTQRPLPSGRVKKKDLAVFVVILISATVVLNIIFMNNFWFFLFLYVYGTLMSLWFFQRKKIQKSLPLALIWEISRKIRAPQEETEYVTYSSLFGYKKATWFVLILTLVDILTNVLLVWNLNKISVAALLINVAWMTVKFIQYIKDPLKFKIVDKVERYTYIQESMMLITVFITLT